MVRALQRDSPRPVWVDPLPPPPRLHFIARGHHSAPRRGGAFNGRGGGHSGYYNSNRGGIAKRMAGTRQSRPLRLLLIGGRELVKIYGALRAFSLDLLID
jgi:hypothetical protein